MIGLHSSFQSERHIAPYVILLIVSSDYTYKYYSGRGIPGVLKFSEAALLV